MKVLDGEFVWSTSQKSLILGAFFWGYLVTQIPGGQLAERFGGKYIYGLSMGAAAIATLLCPFGAKNSFVALILLRVLIGLCEGVAYPTMHTMWANWAPPMERSRLVGFSYSGN